MSDDISATYRGFRKQALYILNRIISDADCDKKVFRPEGAEDLGIFDSSMALVEAVQVKDHSTPLTLSDLKPGSGKGFFSRLRERKLNHPGCVTRIASFGQLGVEFSGAINNTDSHRKNAIIKICEKNKSFSEADAKSALEALQGNILHPEESELYASVKNSLQGSSVSGDLTTSIELLMYWVFEASENQKDVTRTGLLKQLDRISAYLTQIRDSRSEWGTTISPAEDIKLSKSELEYFTLEYRKGVQAKWEHIIAGADYVREAKLDEIRRGFHESSIVVIRGASGQGKSTLGLRYLKDCLPQGLRFQVNLVEGREQAIRISNALASHVQNLNLDAVVFIDVAPSDSGWKELTRRLSDSGLKVLVSVRQEDFIRASVGTEDFTFSEVVLDRITREEAENIFNSIHSHSKSDSLDFEDTWNKFDSASGGPLLEFTHLVSEGESLNSRISNQIRRLRNEAVNNQNGFTPDHIEFLALSSIINHTGARASLRGLCEAVRLSPLTNPLEAFENEYLLREDHTAQGIAVTGLHILRSQVLRESLFSQSPDYLSECILKAVPLVIDEDIEVFLLAHFSRHPGLRDRLVECIQTINPRSWTHCSGIARSLIWEGVSSYEYRNEVSILTAINRLGTSWWIICDSKIGMGPNYKDKLSETLNDITKTKIERVSLSPKEEVFSLLKDWANTAQPPPRPVRPIEWAAAGDISFWIAHCRSEGPIRDTLVRLLPEPKDLEIGLEHIADFISGRSMIGDSEFTDWHLSNSEFLQSRFVSDSKSLALLDNGEELQVLFAIPIADSIINEQGGSTDWHEQTMKRIRLLRRLYPNHSTYSSQSIGIEFFSEELGNDPTTKRIPAEDLQWSRSVLLNSTFLNLVSYRHLRVDHWKQYVDSVIEYRNAVSSCVRKLYRWWDVLISEKRPTQSQIRKLPQNEIENIKNLSNLPMYPRSVVDEWGFTSEDRADIAGEQKPKQLYLKRFKAWSKAFGDYSSSIETVTSKVVDTALVYLSEKTKEHPPTEDELKQIRLALVNFVFAWLAQKPMQAEFRKQFLNLASESRLEELEKFEISNFKNLWPSVFALQSLRNQSIPNVSKTVWTELKWKRQMFLEELKSKLENLFKGKGSVKIQSSRWELNGQSNLCIVCDYSNPSDLESTLPKTISSIWKSCHSVDWRLLEWKPLELEWENIAVVNLIRGKALQPAASIISTATLFAGNDSFEPKFFHYAQQPISDEVFYLREFRTWENPLLRAAVELLNEIVSFVLTSTKLVPLIQLVESGDLDQSALNHLAAQISQELEIVLSAARDSQIRLDEVLATSEPDNKEGSRKEISELCNKILFDSEPGSDIQLRLENVGDWFAGLEARVNQFKVAINTAIESAVSPES